MIQKNHMSKSPHQSQAVDEVAAVAVPKCRKAWARAYYLANKARILARDRARKDAIYVRRKAYASANPEKVKEQELRSQKKWRSKPESLKKRKASSLRHYLKNKKAKNLQATQWAKEHPDRSKLISKKYRQNNPEKLKVRAANYRRNNRDKMRAIGRKWNSDHPGYHTSSNRKWAKENPEKTSLYQARRRMLERAATANLAGIKLFIRSVRSKRLVVCYYCKSEIPSKGCHFDHIVALSKGGPHSVENLCVSCSRCNHQKGNKSISAWVRIGQQVLSL